MFVVRYTTAAKAHHKAFSAPRDARRYFHATMLHMPDEVESSVIFHVPDETDARRAVRAVEEGRAVIIDRDHWAEMQSAADEVVDAWIKAGCP